MEILVVLAIIGLLAGLAISRFGNVWDDAKISAARLWVNTSIKLPLFSYKSHIGNYPTTEQGLQALLVAPANKADLWRGPYLESAKNILDPWGEPYQYAYPGQHNKDGPDIWSKGADGQSGTADDIGNWDTVAPTNK
jgi:general secretion pathway protein G